MAKSKSVRGSGSVASVFSDAARRLREAKAEVVREYALKQAVLETVRKDPAVGVLLKSLGTPLTKLKAALKRSQQARAAGTYVSEPELYLSRSYEPSSGYEWELIYRADILMLSGFKDKYLQRVLDAWLDEAEGQYADRGAYEMYRPAAVVTTEDEAAWHMRKYHFVWGWKNNVRIKATLAAHVRSDSPTCRQEVVTTEEVVERKQYRLICA